MPQQALGPPAGPAPSLRGVALRGSLWSVANKKTAHPIWDMRPADQIAEGDRPDADFVLVRRHEEPYVDILEAQARLANRQQTWERLADAHAQRRIAEAGGEVPGTNDNGESMGFDIEPREASPDDAEDCGPGEVEAAPGENEAAPRIPLEMMDTRKEESRYQQEQDDQRRREERNKQRRLQNRPGAEPSIPDAHKPLFDPAHQHAGAGGLPGKYATRVGRRVRAYHDGGICEGVVMVEFPEGLVDLLLDSVGPALDSAPQRITVGVDDLLEDEEEEDDEGEDEGAGSDREASRGTFRSTAQNVAAEIREGVARAIFHDAWSNAHGFVSVDRLPAIPPEAYAKADEIIRSVEQANGQPIEALYEESMSYNDADAEHFGSPADFGRAIGMGALQPGTFDDYGRMSIEIPPTRFTLTAARTAQVDGPGEDLTGQIREGLARAIFVMAWADTEESEGRGGMGWAGQDLMNLAPDTSPEAFAKADEIIGAIEQANGKSVTDLFHEAMAADGYGEGDYDYFEANRFGHALGMMALGTGVSWFDDHARFPLKVPLNEFDVAPRALDQGEFESAMQSQMPTVEANGGEDEGYDEPSADSEFSVDAAARTRGTRHIALLGKIALGHQVYTEGTLFRVEALSDETLSLISEANRVRHEVSARVYEELTDHGFAEEVYL